MSKTATIDKQNTIAQCDFFMMVPVEPFRKTEEGYLTGKAITTNTGIFKYITKDGEKKRLRTPEEVGDEASLQSMEMIIMSNDHPDDFVTAKNSKKIQVGFTGQDASFDGHAVSITLTITDQEAIDEIEQHGKVALSCGYFSTLEEKTGMAFGNMPYDQIQRDIRYNHIAIVYGARAGDLARLKFTMDSVDISVIDENNAGQPGINDNKLEENMPEKTLQQAISFDGVSYNADKEVIKEYNVIKKTVDTAIAERDALKTEITKLTANLDGANADKKALETKLEESKMSDADIQLAVTERLAIIKVADHLKIEWNKDGKEFTNQEIKTAAILAKYPTAILKDKDAIYIDARFDGVFEAVEKEIKDAPAAEGRKKALGGNLPTKVKATGTDENKDLTRLERRAKFHADLESRHENYKGGAQKPAIN